MLELPTMSFGGSKESFIQCPHDPRHQIRGDRFLYHEIKCRRSKGKLPSVDAQICYLTKMEKQKKMQEQLAEFKKISGNSTVNENWNSAGTRNGGFEDFGAEASGSGFGSSGSETPGGKAGFGSVRENSIGRGFVSGTSKITSSAGIPGPVEFARRFEEPPAGSDTAV